MFQITKETNIGEILENASETIPFFVGMGMHCLGCPASLMESVGDACMVHGVDADDFVEQLNKFIKENSENKDQ